MSELVAKITQWENKMNRLNNALRASGKADISEEDRTMVLKDLIPAEMEEELRKMIKIKAVKDNYQDCRNYVMQEARTLEEKEMRRKDQKASGSQDGLCNGMNEGGDCDHGKGGNSEGEYLPHPPMDALGGKYGGGKWGGKGGGKYGWKGKGDQWG